MKIDFSSWTISNLKYGRRRRRTDLLQCYKILLTLMNFTVQIEVKAVCFNLRAITKQEDTKWMYKFNDHTWICFISFTKEMSEELTVELYLKTR